ncbi:MAG TPA: hypothetical protein VKV26_04695 [Dehalococcoidia bacterium]|nr:hypothetical protein [Dehalococcoidia bacterium]
MSFFARLRGGESRDAQPLLPPTDPRSCRHPVVAPAWASAADMWRKRPPIGFTCRDCLKRFNPDEQPAAQRFGLDRRARV